MQLYRVPRSGGELVQLTDFDEPVAGQYVPGAGGRILLSIDDGRKRAGPAPSARSRIGAAAVRGRSGVDPSLRVHVVRRPPRRLRVEQAERRGLRRLRAAPRRRGAPPRGARRLVRHGRVLARRALARGVEAHRPEWRQRPLPGRRRGRRGGARLAARRRGGVRAPRLAPGLRAPSSSRRARGATRPRSHATTSRPAASTTCSRTNGISPHTATDPAGICSSRRTRTATAVSSCATRRRSSFVRACRCRGAVSRSRSSSPATAASSPTTSRHRVSPGTCGSTTRRRPRRRA